MEFIECDICASKPGSPVLCNSCLNNRYVINTLLSKEKDLMDFLWKTYTFSDPSRKVKSKNILLDIRSESEKIINQIRKHK